MSAAATPSIIITRPQPFAQELAAAVRAEGWNPIILNVLATKTAENPMQVGQQIRSLLPVSQAIFTSRSAVIHTFRILDPADFDGSGIAAIGAGSARELEIHGIDSVLIPEEGSNSEALLQLDQFSANNAGTAIVFCAPFGRDVLQRDLGARGWQVHNAEIYQRVVQAAEDSTLSEIRTAKKLISVCTSGTAIKACKEQLPEDIWEQMLAQTWLVISTRLEALAREAGAQQICQSAGPSNDAITGAIRTITNS